MTGKNEFLTIAPSSSNYSSNKDLLSQVKSIQRLRKPIKIGFFFTDATFHDLQQLFEWSWTYRIINILAATYESYPTETSSDGRLSIFTYNPFGKFKVVNVTSQSFDLFFISQKSNLQQHPLQLTNKFDTDKTRNTWMAVFQVMNCSWKLLTQSASKNSITPFDVRTTLLSIFQFETNLLYPMHSLLFSILTPEALPYSEFTSYLRNILSNEFFVYTSVTIISVIVLLVIARYKNQRKIQFFACATDVFNLLMNDNSAMKYNRLSLVEVFLIVPLTFVGLVIINGIFSNLQSHITKPFQQPQIKTLEDIYRSPLPVITFAIQYKTSLVNVLEARTKYNWTDKVIMIPSLSLEERRTSFDRSAMYLTKDEIVTSLLEVQKNLQIPGFYKAEKGVFRAIGGHVMHEEFQFAERVNEIFHWIHSAGLYDLWLRQENDQRVKSFLEFNIERMKNETFHNAGIGTVSMPTFIAYGWCASIILFIVELIWFNISRQNRINFIITKLRNNEIKVRT
ncbi:hypothetical protein Bhyg_00554 [Pseudolycoriella hygida]|uniref:Ionotropic receptor n=1 Tax=Pseudolycoriella hygida TaxID=35572 RepID=A0A9Q0N9V9_9DIPT|nr:hypothetical protein Bhyg_00554 [Pseudolycoriella hygida]